MHLNRQTLRKMMFTKNVNQTELATLTGISRTTINGILSGRSCSSSSAHKIAKALEIPIESILDPEQ